MSAPVEVRTERVPPEAGAPQGVRPKHQLRAWLGVLAVGLSAIVGSNAFGVRDHFFEPATPQAAPPAAGRVAGGSSAPDAPAAPTQLRSQPWWQDVTTVEGTGTTSSTPFTIMDGAVQWRVKGTCQTGRIVVRATSLSRPLVDAPCTGEVSGIGSRSGPMTLQVTADGPWRLVVAQQIDSPLVEPPLPAMTGPGAAAVSRGSLYNIDKTGVGKVTLYRQSDGRYAIRLDDFFVSPNADLELRLSTVEAPKTSQEYLSGDSELVVVMDVTAGSLNYPVPAGIDPTRFKSVVVWCAPVVSAYAAASLGPVR